MTLKAQGKSAKTQLVMAIQQLLQKGEASTQEDIRQALLEGGLDVNQAMISRVLHKVGAIKMNEAGHTVYRLPAELAAVTAKNSLSQLILGIAHNEAQIVIQTMPGSAQLVARLLDQGKKMGVLGTVAGDDTIFVAPVAIKNIETTMQNISKILLR